MIRPLKQTLITCFLLLYTMFAYAFSWQDLWQNADNRAQKLMQKKRYTEAQETFKRLDWRATAAFRAGQYEKASTLFENLKQADGYYNAGNAYAYQGNYAAAIKAYDKSLALDKHNQDAIDNRHIVEDLLKKQSSQNDQDKTTSSSNPQNQQNTTQGKSPQDKPSAADSSRQTPHNEPQQNSQSTPKSSPDKSQPSDNIDSNSKENPDSQTKKQPQSSQSKQEQAAKTKQNAQTDTQPAQQQATKKLLDKQTTDQWLNMIPDDPGGLLREKFLRDYLRRRGES